VIPFRFKFKLYASRFVENVIKVEVTLPTYYTTSYDCLLKLIKLLKQNRILPHLDYEMIAEHTHTLTWTMHQSRHKNLQLTSVFNIFAVNYAINFGFFRVGLPLLTVD
jgi:hypothetical protein